MEGEAIHPTTLTRRPRYLPTQVMRVSNKGRRGWLLPYLPHHQSTSYRKRSRYGTKETGRVRCTPLFWRKGKRAIQEGYGTAMTLARFFKTNMLYCGDNLERLRHFPDESVDLIYLDPPALHQKPVLHQNSRSVRLGKSCT